MSGILTLVNARDTYNFYTGQPLKLSHGTWIPITWWDRAKDWFLTKFVRPTMVVTEVNVKTGTVTLESKPRWWQRVGRR